MLMCGLTKHLTLLSPCSFSAAGLADRALTLIFTLGRAAGIRAGPLWQSLTAVSSRQTAGLLCSKPHLNPCSIVHPLAADLGSEDGWSRAELAGESLPSPSTGLCSIS